MLSFILRVIFTGVILNTIVTDLTVSHARFGEFFAFCNQMNLHKPFLKLFDFLLQARGVDGSIFQEAKRLHLTLCLTPFLNDAEVVSLKIWYTIVLNLFFDRENFKQKMYIMPD